MKKLVSLIFAIAAVFLLSITAFGAEVPLRLFSVDEKDSPVKRVQLEDGTRGILCGTTTSGRSYC